MDKGRILELKNKIKDYKSQDINEEDTKNGLIQPFLSLFGWDFTNLNEIKSQQKGKDGSTPDYLLKIESKTVLIVEAKPINFNLDNEKEILGKLKYFNTHDCPLLLITNGNIYSFYYNDIKGKNYKDKLLFEYQLESDGELDLVKLIAKNDFKLLEYAKLVKYQKYIKIALNSIFKNPPKDFLDMINAKLLDNQNELDKLSYDDIKIALNQIKLYNDFHFPDSQLNENHNLEPFNTVGLTQTKTNQKSTKNTNVSKFLDGAYPNYLKLYNDFLILLKKNSIYFNLEFKNDYIKLENGKGSFLLIYPQSIGLKIYFPFEINYARSNCFNELAEGKDSSTGKFKCFYRLKNDEKLSLILDYIQKYLMM